MGYFRVQPSSHCGCGPVAGTGFTKPEKKKKEAAQCEGCFCKFARKAKMASFSSVTIDGTEYTTDITLENIIAHLLGTRVLVGSIQLVGCPKKNNCCVTFQFTPLLGTTIPAAILGLLGALLALLGLTIEELFPGGAPFTRIVDCEKVSSFAPVANGMMMF
ncbi:hypothetical protein [Alkalihalophilus marmarensis]|uniref:Uncharacterized protein n=1 Tax=Alkalihalophilus marmarensis DSM 21297 TaxID=1188261 RepID=U6SPS5_9BACI|nr:hypothetical protein [Alkalihalophilus marmarensis]ERN53734.1 hypothetical protein A33I_11035 [Alkalihalophilus marmarensis DSM 21297]